MNKFKEIIIFLIILLQCASIRIKSDQGSLWSEGAVNEPCYANNTCQEGLFCVRDHMNEYCSKGVQGNVCDGDYQCVQGLNCQSYKCEPWGGLGQFCSETHPCQAPNTCTSGKCLFLAQAGQSCNSTHICQSGNYCMTDTKICESLRTLGENCYSQTNNCAAGLICMLLTSKTCQKPVQAGGLCLDQYMCASGIKCMVDKKICSNTPQQDGGFCVDQSFCASGLVCNALESKCRAPRAASGACRHDGDCQNNLRCSVLLITNSGTCQPTNKSYGSWCLYDWECTGGSHAYCKGLGFNNGQCFQAQPNGKRCDDNRECLGGYCSAQNNNPNTCH